MSFEHMSRQELVALLDELLVRHLADDQARRASSDEQTARLDGLRVHQVETETPDGGLRDARSELEASHQRYLELYDFAPVAYLTLDGDLTMRALNLTAAALLGGPRSRLVGRSFIAVAFVRDPAPLVALITRAEPWSAQSCELVLEVKGKLIPVQVIATASAQTVSADRHYRCALLDISQRKQVEAERDRAYAAEQMLHRRFEALDRIGLALSTLLATNERASADMLLAAVVEPILYIMDATATTISLAPENERAGPAARARAPDDEVEPRYEIHVPMKLGARHIGDISVRYVREPPADAGRTVQLLAERLALALERVRLNRLETAERARLGLLASTAQELARGTDTVLTREALGAAARCAIPTFASGFALYLFEGEVLKLASSHHRDVAQRRRLQKFAAYAGCRLSAQPAQRAELTDGSALKFACSSHAQLQRVGAKFGVGTLLVIPLMGRRGPLGIICFGWDDAPRAGDAQNPLEELARRCATALDQAILLDELRETVKARDMLLALVSHDLRNPLNAISLTAGSMIAPPERVERRKSSAELKLIQRSAAHMHVMLEDLLTAASIDAGKFTIEAVPVDAALLVRDALTMTEPLLKARQLTLEQQCEANLPAVHADPLRVQQVFSNLIGNAAKFTPYGGTLRVTAMRDGAAVRFGVSDSGPGIAPEVIPLIFRRYWTASGSHRSTSLGLGLFIAQRIVDAHGGRIWAESVVGEGASFYFTLATVEAVSPR